MGWIINSSGKQTYSYPIVSETAVTSKTAAVVQTVATGGDHDHQIVIDATRVVRQM